MRLLQLVTVFSSRCLSQVDAAFPSKGTIQPSSEVANTNTKGISQTGGSIETLLQSEGLWGLISTMSFNRSSRKYGSQPFRPRD
jgi:hypothetical protein